jgi:hypothetical protein
MYADGQLVAEDLVVWFHAKQTSLHEGRFHIPTNFEVLTGAKYHLEPQGEKAKLLDMPGGHAMEVLITEVSGQIAHFAPLAATSPVRAG